MLSQQLQDRTVTIPKADKLIRRSNGRIQHTKGKPGEKMKKAEADVETSMFGTTKLEGTDNIKHTNKRLVVFDHCG